MPTVSLQNITLHGITEQHCADHIIAQLNEHRGGWVITANLDHFRRSLHDPDYRMMLTEADLVVADGMPIIWAAALQNTPLPERVAGSSMISTLSQRAAEAGKSIFLLGGEFGTAQQAAEVLVQRHPGLRVAGTHFPPFGFEADSVATEAMVRAITGTRPDIVFVALGSPKQERLIRWLRHEHPAAWWLGVGISFSFLSGDVKRAPRWMQRIGAEWIHRLVQEPRRLARRYLIEGIPYALRLLSHAALHRRQNQDRASASDVSADRT